MANVEKITINGIDYILTSPQDQIKQAMLDMVYPVGSIYMSVNSTSPESFLGGEWERLTDRFLVGAGNKYAVNASSGAEYHSHNLNSGYAEFVGYNSGKLAYNEITLPENLKATYNHEVQTEAAERVDVYEDSYGTQLGGYTSTASNMPPYLAVYMWKRNS